MTLPFEEKRAINYTRKFLQDLTNPKTTPRVPKDIRERAGSLLRHYPYEYRVDEIMTEEKFGLNVL